METVRTSSTPGDECHWVSDRNCKQRRSEVGSIVFAITNENTKRTGVIRDRSGSVTTDISDGEVYPCMCVVCKCVSVSIRRFGKWVNQTDCFQLWASIRSGRASCERGSRRNSEFCVRHRVQGAFAKQQFEILSESILTIDPHSFVFSFRYA